MNSLFIGTSNELGGFESGFVAHWLGPVFSVFKEKLGAKAFSYYSRRTSNPWVRATE